MVKNKPLTGQERQDYIDSFASTIKTHFNDLPLIGNNVPYDPIKNINKNGIDVASWFSIKHSSNNYRSSDVIFKLPIDSNFEARKTIRIDLYPNNHQKLILNKWFYAYTDMFNASIRIIRSRLFLHDGRINNKILNFQYLRTNLMMNIKNNIIRESILNNDSKTRIKSNVLDMAIQNACTCYKSHVTNFKNKNIKKISKVKYWCFNRRIQTINLIKPVFGNNGFTTLGDLDARYNNNHFDLSKIKKESLYNVDPILQFNRKTNRYCLYLPIKQKTKKNFNPLNIISLDPGIRTFMTGVNESNNVEIGKDAQLKIMKHLLKIDKINNLKDDLFKIRKEPQNEPQNDQVKMPKDANERKNIIKIWRQNKLDLHRRKISQYVDELHWKTIRYLTKKYKNILIGDMSIQGISSKSGNLSDITKRIGYSLKFYKFKQRLMYKCGINKIGYKEIDERYTSKLCSRCGNEHKTLGSSKVYNCVQCGLVLDRDINGARNIYLKSKMLI